MRTLVARTCARVLTCRSSDGSGSGPGDPDLVIAGGGSGGGGVVAEALVNAHMSELTQTSGTARTKEVDRVIRRCGAC